jgi:hypothetical protein
MTPRANDEKLAATPNAPAPVNGLLSNEDRWMRLGLFGVAACCILAAVAHSIWPGRVDQTTAQLLGFAAAAMVLHQVSKFEFFGVKLERLQQVVRAEVKPVTERVDVIEQQGMLPGRSQADEQGRIAIATTPPDPSGGQVTPQTDGRGDPAHKVSLIAAAVDEWDSDPNKGLFGGSSQTHGRKLSAQIKPAASHRSAACKIHISVASTDDNKPLTGKVRFYLHPTFGRWRKYDVAVKNGMAEDDITSWGAFTIGVEADDGNTRLELDLSDVRGGTEKFYQE